ncbi:MAG: tRNA preQ1(34) S-adenosylmethionine ribosyltransferase-isomerase QueA [Methylotenera sp.]|nr:tRNA preQ1(34) S-adenosylmethionine ribosyltransferase-isomerase QueA [Methylotenera sp.]HPH08695.1 tRNA preQ1(34) S-adenosylmethionine ribosyltransferase-isomerase QueA [Methylotenera sp.]HPM48981.1 tRNA preQ1(34) S-adenosylmethionine ribosyltransferase-isomerase QueA [Methylotenera sp.]HQM87117.1 tRNA preQ1(34) S-adenosylmethionine ribosyltransferase-isomerase QueA [Methylotenera sp.]
MRTLDFDFYLPEALIAQHPTKNRSASRLLRLDGNTGSIQDAMFTNLLEALNSGDLLVLNDTRVIKARLFGEKLTGGKIEVMIERVVDAHHALAQIKASRAPKAGSKLVIAGKVEAEVIGRQEDLFLLQFSDSHEVMDILDLHGSLPLPPYITHAADADDETRYQTVFAKHAGAVAAPTAGLHFDDTMLNQLKAKGVNIAFVTLHVGAGTFKPVKTELIADHKMHSEIYTIPQATIDLIAATRTNGGKVTAVGTTALRALESAAQHQALKAGQGETAIFITPGYSFKVVDRLLTNFHLPKSTLLMLVSAFAGFENTMRAYQHAIEKQYRFFSYGDAMLIERKRNLTD